MSTPGKDALERAKREAKEKQAKERREKATKAGKTNGAAGAASGAASGAPGAAAGAAGTSAKGAGATAQAGPAAVLFGTLEDQLALELTRRHQAELRYCHEFGAWLRWDGKRWEKERTLVVFDLARRVCRAALAFVKDKREAERIARASTRAAVENLARSDRAHAMVSEQFDQDVWALNTPAGIVDLKTGQLLPHDPERYHTKITRVGPADHTDCPLFLKFLMEITAGDLALVAYIRRSFGYALTGVTVEQILQFLHGGGANGKSVLLGILLWILGDYGVMAPMELFIASQNDRHPTDLAMLRGARLVVAIETEQGRRWAETKIKSLTGGDPVTARFMRQDFFTYTPLFKLMIAGNHKPTLRGVDEAIKRRFHLWPFNVTIPKDDRDPELLEKLKAEGPAILRWAIEGCLEWQAGGLKPPPVVLEATAAYFNAEDVFQAWLDEKIEPAPGAWVAASELWASWREWAERSGEYVGSQKAFGQLLVTRGFEPTRTGGPGTRGYRNLRLRNTLSVAAGT